MSTLIAGATGATGRLLVAQLIQRGQHVRAIVRSPERLPAEFRDHACLTMIQAPILDLAEPALTAYVAGCDAVACCLGHSLTLGGVFGPPQRLVTGAVERLCQAIRRSEGDRPVRFVLMSSTGCRNHDLQEPISLLQRIVVGGMRVLLPPHADNVQAAEYLRTRIGQDDPRIEWSAVRPDNLTQGDGTTGYEVHPSPIRSAIFDAGSTSRLNVARFMAQLITDDATWRTWRGRMPVIYDTDQAV